MIFQFDSKNTGILLTILIVQLTACSTARWQTMTNKDMPFDLLIDTASRQLVMKQTLPYEEQMLGYFKVLKMKKDSWQMWYSSWDNRRDDDYSGFLEYASSVDGLHWKKEIPGRHNNILQGNGPPFKDGIVEQDVIYDASKQLPYQMIFTAKDSSDQFRQKTFIQESADGINWENRHVLWDQKYDSQFSIVQDSGKYFIYLRYWNEFKGKRYRSIGLAIADTNWKVLQAPTALLESDPAGDFPHLYNPAASRINGNLTLFFPTFFNEKNNAIRFGLGFRYKNKARLTDIDISKALLQGTGTTWGIICPGLIPAGKNSYWLYYYASNMLHSEFEANSKHFDYYRIRIRVLPY